MQRLVLLGLTAATTATTGAAFLAPVPVRSTTQGTAATTTMKAEGAGATRKDALVGAGAALLLGGLGVVAPGPAKAEFTPSQRKQQYFRYAPRIKKARDIFAGDFKKALDAKDWKKLLSFYEPEAQAPESSMRNNPNRFINVFEKDLYNPMKIYAQSFSEKGASPRLAQLLDAEERVEAAINRIKNVAKGDLKKPTVKSEGFLFGLVGGGEADAGADKYSGLSQDAMAKALWTDAKDALNDYFTVCNKYLGLEVRAFEPI